MLPGLRRVKISEGSLDGEYMFDNLTNLNALAWSGTTFDGSLVEASATKSFLQASRRLEEPRCRDQGTCFYCSAFWPRCAWCASSATCHPAPAELVEFAKQSPWTHAVYSQEIYNESYGVFYPDISMAKIDSCDVWIFNSDSCQHIADYCKPLQTCFTCTAVSVCGFCYDRVLMKGRCSSGTRRSEIGIDTGVELCRNDEHSLENNVSKAWMFGDWVRYHKAGVWDGVCDETCKPQQAVFTENSGEFGVGSQLYNVGYLPHLLCSWKVYPNALKGNFMLDLELRFSMEDFRGDIVSVYEAAAVKGNSAGIWNVGAEIGHIGCRIHPVECIKRFHVISPSPVVIVFESVSRDTSQSLALGGNSWIAQWNLTPRLPGAALTRPSSSVNYLMGEILYITLGAIAIILPLIVIGIVLRKRWLGRSRESPTNDRTTTNTHQGFDFDALETNPSCRPTILGAACATDQCSVCLADLEAGEECRSLPCGHVYHRCCIDSWLRTRSVCPLCRVQVRGSRQYEMTAHDWSQWSRVPPAAVAAAMAAARNNLVSQTPDETTAI